ncbi:MAG TPA: flavoprotein [Leptospiraceae bacterium]|jgi:phosphopantothenoylcysteine decarboxylase|nr:phosphopantothenoylcysteine decarboxylase [Leptospirales bacterium]HMU82191.1 flavoprotein [Leptospiraceae bacterium]HMX54944.1 flavoprotein [Leptospiraceae bacterium]HMY45892.1 flavoprotein [Leptospiraceae bacterium]HMZ37088.1 flavoprotein [Leptospiraceae bacterium]
MKSVVIGVTGSIAAYRTCDLIRSLTKKGVSVHVCMTESAEHFVGRITFEALTGQRVYTSQWESGMPHIELKRLSKLLAIVPATADIIGKFASGIADDLLSSTYLAHTGTVLIAPSMNPGMYASKAVQRNLQRLREDGVILVDPANGEAVCGDEGQGKLATIEQIESRILELI